MTSTIETTKATLETLRLPELQARYREVVGEGTRCPNRMFLIRKISEALEETQTPNDAPEEEPVMEQTDYADGEGAGSNDGNGLTSDEGNEQSAAQVAASRRKREPSARGRFSALTVAELQAKYVETVGRATGSDDRRYLIWKIREAEKGRIPVGPRPPRQASSNAGGVKILPLRLSEDATRLMDEAWRGHGITSRMEFLRRAIAQYLHQLGEAQAAEAFTQHNDG